MAEAQTTERRKTATEPPTTWRWWFGTAGWAGLSMGIGLTPAFWLAGLTSVIAGGLVAPAITLGVVWAVAGWATGHLAGVRGPWRLLPAITGFAAGVALLLGGVGGFFHPLYLVGIWLAIVLGAWLGRTIDR